MGKLVHMDNPEALLSVTQAARLSGISRSTLQRAVDAGQLPTVGKLPGRRGAYLLDPGAVEQYALDLAREHEARARTIREAVAS